MNFRRFLAVAVGILSPMAAACATLPEDGSAPTATAVAEVATDADATSAHDFDRNDADPALWKLSDDDTTIYLFGTMHALQDDVVWFDDAVGEAFASADELVLEMVEPDPMAQRGFIAANAIYTDGSTLDARLSAEQRDRLAKGAKTIGLPPAAFRPMRPWFAAVTMASAPLQSLGYKPEAGAEAILQSAARERGMPIEGLETFEQQMGFFTALPEADQIEFLMSSIDDLADIEASFAKMQRAWATGDVVTTGEIINEGLEETPLLYETLLAGRNRHWADWIGSRMDRPGTVFVAVGAGHLAGDDSVQALLKARGMIAERVVY